MTRLKRKLVETLAEMESGRLSPLTVDVPESTAAQQQCSYKDLILNSAVNSVKQGNYLAAIEYQKMAQKNWPNEFGRLSENDFDTILLVVCQQKRNEYPSKRLFVSKPQSLFGHLDGQRIYFLKILLRLLIRNMTSMTYASYYSPKTSKQNSV
jgi:hypothetical protein